MGSERNILRPGLTQEVSWIVEERHLVSYWVKGAVAVFGTPMLVALCEESARRMVDPLLPKGEMTVGISIRLRHIAATPKGMRVTAKAELREVEDRLLRFHIRAWDDVEQIAEAEHERFIVDTERFNRRIQEKVGPKRYRG